MPAPRVPGDAAGPAGVSGGIGVDLRDRKRLLRGLVRDRILALDPADRARQEHRLLAEVPRLPGFDRAGMVLLYASAFPEEIPTAGLLALVLDRGRALACPRVDRPSRRLVLHRVDDPSADFRPGVRGIPEPRDACPVVPPEAIDWALVPGLAFDARGFRLGRGAGHYDRLLPLLRPDAPRWALALDPQWVDDLPVEPHDQPLDGVLGVSRAVGPRPPA